MSEQEEDKSQKTEQPTAHKLDKARKDGQVTLSKEVGHWFMLLALALILTYVFPSSFKRLALFMQYYFEHASQIPVNSGSMIDVTTSSLKNLGSIFALPILFLIIAAIASGLVQTRGMVSLKGMKPKLSKVSPGAGVKRLFGSKALVEFFKNVIKLAIIISIAYMVMRPEFDHLHTLPQLSALGILEELSEVFLKLLIVVISVITVVAALDYGYQKYKFIQDLKMSKKEIKDEYKELVGDPHIKGKLRQLREERARSRMMQDVPQATVIMTNPTHYAVALRYDLDAMDTPILLAKGSDLIALKIKETGEENDIPIIENPPLTRAIYANVQIGEEIPAQYFEAVARVIRYIFGYDTYYQSHLDDGIDEA
ncbi:MAG TPA: flagellar biosynthesis protein FlhB [Holosporales bacterium]|nr:flagellar biosynthesis protein FlhB [Holosporales bacterium]